MESLPPAFTESEEPAADAATRPAGLEQGSEAESEAGEFRGCTGAEWVLWRAVRSQTPRLVHESALLFDDPIGDAAAT